MGLTTPHPGGTVPAATTSCGHTRHAMPLVRCGRRPGRGLTARRRRIGDPPSATVRFVRPPVLHLRADRGRRPRGPQAGRLQGPVPAGEGHGRDPEGDQEPPGLGVPGRGARGSGRGAAAPQGPGGHVPAGRDRGARSSSGSSTRWPTSASRASTRTSRRSPTSSGSSARSSSASRPSVGSGRRRNKKRRPNEKRQKEERQERVSHHASTGVPQPSPGTLRPGPGSSRDHKMWWLGVGVRPHM